MKKRILSCLMALALCLTLLPTAALAEETEGTAQTSPAVKEAADPANGEAKQESRSAEQEEQQEDSASKQDEAVAAVQAMINALPDAKALDGMNDEDAMAVYEAFQTACDAYYETLTEEQQEQLKNTEKLAALSEWFSQSAAIAAGGHQHPVCGASCTDGEKHDNVTWTGAYGVTGLRAGGHYYLIRDVKVSETWHPEDGVVLCLNGHSITATTRSINVIEVDEGKTFTLTDCTGKGGITHDTGMRGRGVMVFGTFNMYGGNISGNQTDGNYNDRGTFGAGVYVATGSIFNMSGGKITGNTGYSGGGSVYVAPTYAASSRAVFNMSGGEISGNSSLYGDSSGVYVNGGEFIMSGGSIIGNAGYGVDLCTYKDHVGGTYPGTFTVSGKVSVTGNYKKVYNNGTLVGTLDYNVFLSTGETITIDGTLNPESRIGITTQGEASAVITTGEAVENFESIFSSDVKDKGYSFTKDENGAIRFHGHDHNWQFAATTNMIWAKCTTPGCPVTTIDSIGTDEHCNGGFVWLKVQDTTYGDNSKNAWVDASKQTTWRGPAVSTIKIHYRNSVTDEDLGTTAPTLPGSYTASIMVEGLTVTCGFKINKATPTINWNGYPYTTGFTGTFTGNAIADPTGVTVLVNGSSSADLLARTTFTWYAATKTGSSYSKASDTPLEEGKPIDAGDYLMEAVIPATDTTNEATYTKGVTIQKAQDLGGSDVVVPVALKMYPSAEAKTYTVDLLEVLTDYRHGGSLALNSTGIIFYDTDLLTSAILNGNTVEITMKPTANVPANRTVTVSVFLTSRNYETIPVIITLTMQPKPTVNDIAVTMDSWTYGNTPNSPLYEAAAGVTYQIAYAKADGTPLSEKPTDAGSYTVTVSYETDTEIHSSQAVAFTISPKALQQEMLARITGDRYYNGTEQTPDVTVTDGEKTLEKDVDYTVSYSNNTNASTPTSQAVATVTGKGNYEGIISTTFVINPVTLGIMGEERMTATASYGTKVKEIPVSSAKVYYYDSGNKLTIVPGTWKFDGDGMDDIPEVGNTKKYKAVFTPTSGSENYRECFTYITPSISRADGSVTAPAAKTDLVYNGGEQDLLATLPTSATGTVWYSQDGTNYTKTPPMGKKAGTYTVFYKVVGDKNHLDVAVQSIDVKIEKLAITVTAENKTSRVGQTLAELTYTYTPELAAGDAFTGTLESNARPDATGEYPITRGTLALNENYTIDFHAGTYTVADKLVQSDFRFESIPSAVSKTYGDPDFSAGAVGAAEGSTVTYESSEPTVATVDGTGKVTIKGAGTAVITARASATDEYAEAAATCTLTVGKKPIAIPTADATVFTYNGTEQTYALAENEAYTVSGNKQTNANETGYSVTAALKDTANTQWADGTTANKTYTFVIGKAVITVKAKDQTAYVGDKVPTLGEDSYTVSGLVGEEKLTTQPTVKYVGADGKEITPDMTKTGEVKILAGGAVASDNYTIRYEDGKLTITTRPSSGGSGGSRPSTHPVKAEVSKDPDGTVSLSKTNAAKGDKVTITVKPERHYEVDEVIVRDSKGKQLAVKDNGDGTFTFEMPADKVTVEPTFTWVNPFADVANSAYYVDAVEWMLKREVTQGTTETTFSPNLNCTRAQIVTFLWRAAGSPEPKGTVGFADVSAGSYYAKAVAWAIENGITGGTGDGLFSPDAACTRAQSAAFLYRAAGSPAVSGSAGFSDVAADAYYAQAVAWAKEHGITDGIGGGLFGSANDCTRAQIAAFLWRLYAEK